jgi:hypothetical protein
MIGTLAFPTYLVAELRLPNKWDTQAAFTMTVSLISELLLAMSISAAAYEDGRRAQKRWTEDRKTTSQS